MKDIAVFIDAENIPAKYADEIFKYAAKYGNIVIKRIYADWSKENIQNWKNPIFEHGLVAMQQFSPAHKNSADIYLVSEVLSIFYEKQIDVFIIVSSDCDYTSLIHKLRENKKTTIGIGMAQVAKSYANAFHKFHILDSQTEQKTNAQKDTKLQIACKNFKAQIDKVLENQVGVRFGQIGQAHLIDYKKFGFSTLAKFIKYFVEQESCYKIARTLDNSDYFLLKKPKKALP